MKVYYIPTTTTTTHIKIFIMYTGNRPFIKKSLKTIFSFKLIVFSNIYYKIKKKGYFSLKINNHKFLF